MSEGLRQLTTQLQIFDLRAMITEDMVPPSNTPPTQQWSHMRRLKIEFHPLRPDGRRYFTGPRGEDPHDSEDGGFRITRAGDYPSEFDTPGYEEIDEKWEDDPDRGRVEEREPDLSRTQPCRERLESLLVAFAQALTNMPELEEAELLPVL